MRRAAAVLPFLPVLLLSLACVRPPAADPEYVRSIEAARAARHAELTTENGWLTIVAREALTSGENAFGSDPSSRIALEGAGIPPKAGAFVVREDGDVLLRAEPGAPVTVNGAPPTDAPLVPEGDASPDVIAVGRVRLAFFQKDGAPYVRARDPESARLRDFPGLSHFPIDPALRVEGRWEPYDAPREVEVPSSQGPPRTALAPGLVRFTLAGKELSLEPTVESLEDDTLFFVFADATSGMESYGGGRFLSVPRPAAAGDRVVLDFNLAETPPCSLTPFASCPMALPRNTLPIRVEAGEMAPSHH
ncbi:MAG: DUF1684 domain-containing protein [Thermoanaerobaculia bacterium]